MKISIFSLLSLSLVSGSRHVTAKSRASDFADVNEALYKWFCIAHSKKNIYSGGPELIEKSKEIADKLGKPNFQGSRGWLDNRKKRCSVRQLKISGNLVTLKVHLLTCGRSVYQKLSMGKERQHWEHGWDRLVLASIARQREMFLQIWLITPSSYLL